MIHQSTSLLVNEKVIHSLVCYILVRCGVQCYPTMYTGVILNCLDEIIQIKYVFKVSALEGVH